MMIKGIGAWYISSATIDARAKKESGNTDRIAAGAVWARTDSSRIAVVVLEPRGDGRARIGPVLWF